MCNKIRVIAFSKLILFVLLFLSLRNLHAEIKYVYDENGNPKYAYNTGDNTNHDSESNDDNESNKNNDSKNIEDNSNEESNDESNDESENNSDDDEKNNSNNSDENSDSDSDSSGKNEDSSDNDENNSSAPETENNSDDVISNENFEQKEIDSEADKLEADSQQLSENNNIIPDVEDSTEVRKATEDLEEEIENNIAGKEDEAKDLTEENIKLLEENEKIAKELLAGDPVRIAEGYYEQSETDFSVGNLPVIKVSRNYNSQSSIISSFGYGWSSNFDERIILGVDAGVDELERLFLNNKESLALNISNFQNSIKAIYKVSDVYNAKAELSERIRICSENLGRADTLCNTVNSLIGRIDYLISIENVTIVTQESFDPVSTGTGNGKSNDSDTDDESEVTSSTGFSAGRSSSSSAISGSGTSTSTILTQGSSGGFNQPQNDTVTRQKEIDYGNEVQEERIPLEETKEKLLRLKTTFENQRNAIAIKYSELQSAFNRIDADLGLLSDLNSKYALIASKYEELLNAKEKHRIINARNDKACFSGMGKEYVETGFNTLTLIDEFGFPHLFYKSEPENRWENNTEKRYSGCEKRGDGFIVFENDGTKKEFDAGGLIIKIEDTYGNYINIQRDFDESIKYVVSSSGEKLKIEYENSFVNKITNVRLPTQCAEYNYQGNKLVSVKDTEGDIVHMEYDVDGRITMLRKCDGSIVRFLHEELTADGKVLTTATVNEEGFYERFVYDRSKKRTDYINHDGNRTSYWYDEHHRTIREIKPDGTEIKNEYDTDGNLISVNENGNVIKYNYDSRGNKIHALYSDFSFEGWTYDGYNKITSYIDRDGVRTEYIRNQKGSLLEEKVNGKSKYAQEYDSKGQLIRKSIYGEKTIITDYQYDLYGNIKEEKCGNVKSVFEYDAANRIKKIYINDKLISEFEYANHSIKQKDFNGLETIFLTNGRKDIYKVIQKDSLTNMIHESRIDYDKRHLPVRVFSGNGENEKLIQSYLYSPEGKIKIIVLNGEESWVRFYEYKNEQISSVKQFKITESLNGCEDENYFRELMNKADEYYEEKYKCELQNNNRRLITVTDGFGVKNLFEYDSYGNLERITDGNGIIRETFYTKTGKVMKDESLYGGFYQYKYKDGMLSAICEENLVSEKVDYYSDGSLKSITDSYGKNTFYYYDESGLVCCIHSPSKKIWYEYDYLGRVTKQVVGDTADELKSVYFVNFDYSDDGRSIIATEGGKYTIRSVLDAFGNLIKEVDGNNNERSFVYNDQNQLIKYCDGYENEYLYTYNAIGLVSSFVWPDGAQILYKYNHMGQVEEITDECGIVYKASYDKAGRLVKEFNRADCERFYEYDNNGRLLKVKFGNETVEDYTYGADRRTIVVKDGNRNDYIYQYDPFGRLTGEINRKGDNQSYFFDAGGSLKSKSNFDGTTSTINYSADRSIMTVRYSDGSENRYVYDAVENIAEAENAYGSSLYKYDQGGRLVSQKDMTTGEEIYFEYDDAGNRIKLSSSNRETFYTYGKNNEIKEIFDNKQRISIKLKYDKNGREVIRTFGNGIQNETLYDRAGRIRAKMQKSARGEILWSEGYLYGEDGKCIAKVDNTGCVTLYEYNKKGQLQNVYYPYSEDLEKELKAEAEENGLAYTAVVAENKYLPATIKQKLISLMNSMQYGLAYNIANLQSFVKESYSYDKNGNRISKSTKLGTINYYYDIENCLLSSGSCGKTFISYSYDKMGNLLTEESSSKSKKYAYNSQNRLVYCEVTDKSKKEYSQTNYAYDTFGRRLIVQDAGEIALRTLYDGLTFDIVKQSPTFENGIFTDSKSSGIQWTKTGRPTGDRYRYIGKNDVIDENRYFYLNENTYKFSNNRYRGERTHININGSLAVQTTYDYGAEYFSTDLLGSVSSITDNYGNQKMKYSYDAFGSLVHGELAGSTDFGYLSKQNDSTSHLYNYGYRDYKTETSRFTTVDPIRDGANWYLYCNGDPVNFVDFDGLIITNFSAYTSMSDYKDTKINNTSSTIANYGCAMTGMVNIINEFRHMKNPNNTVYDENTHEGYLRTLTPEDINVPEHFKGNSDNLDWDKVANTYGLKAKRSKNKEDALRMLRDAQNSKKQEFLLIQVPITIGEGKDKIDVYHWVGHSGKTIRYDGKDWIQIVPTSKNDSLRDIKNSNWMIKDEIMYVLESVINGAVVVTKKNK